MTVERTFVIAISGASGAVYGLRLVKALAAAPDCRIMLIVTDAGMTVLEHECGYDPAVGLQGFLRSLGIIPEKPERLQVFRQNQIAAPPASGSFRHSGMVVAPCSMKTLALIASGVADNLLVRSADVCLKEKRPLILLPRETPWSLIHLENMVRACRAGATIMPPCPSFYSGPNTIEALVDTVVARVLDHLAVAHDLVGQWGVSYP